MLSDTINIPRRMAGDKIILVIHVVVSIRMRIICCYRKLNIRCAGRIHYDIHKMIMLIL